MDRCYNTEAEQTMQNEIQRAENARKAWKAYVEEEVQSLNELRNLEYESFMYEFADEIDNLNTLSSSWSGCDFSDELYETIRELI